MSASASPRRSMQLVQHKPVAVHCLEAAGPALDVVGPCTCDSLAEDNAVGTDELHRGAGVEPPFAADDADPEQARSFLDQSPACSFVDVEPAGNGLAEAEPQLERRLAAILRGE